MGTRRPPLPYYVAYQTQEENKSNIGEMGDRDYFRQLYPQIVKRYLRVIVDVLDRMEIRESYIYDEYPDKVRIERLTEIILRLIPLENNMNRETQRNLVRVLLLDEIVERRKINNDRNSRRINI